MILGIPGFVHSPVDRIDSSRYRIVLEIHLLGTEYLGDSGENHSSPTDIRSDIGEDLLGYRIPIAGMDLLGLPPLDRTGNCRMTQRPYCGFGGMTASPSVSPALPPLVPFLVSISYPAITMAVSTRSANKIISSIESSFQTLSGLRPVTRFREWIRCSTVARERYMFNASNGVNRSEGSRFTSRSAVWKERFQSSTEKYRYVVLPEESKVCSRRHSHFR